MVLAQCRDVDAPDNAGTYLMKRLELHHGRARLVSRSRGIAPIVVDEVGWSVVAVLVEVLGYYGDG